MSPVPASAAARSTASTIDDALSTGRNPENVAATSSAEIGRAHV